MEPKEHAPELHEPEDAVMDLEADAQAVDEVKGGNLLGTMPAVQTNQKIMTDAGTSFMKW